MFRCTSVGLALVTVGLLAFLLLDITWFLVGTARGESFYESRPTTYWSGELARWEPPLLT